MTPLQIQMMLHYHSIAKPYAYREPEHANSPAVRDQRSQLVQMQLLQACAGETGYILTERGRVYIDMLREMELPVQKWCKP